MALPREINVADAAVRCRTALEELEALDPDRYALAHWLSTSYRNALLVGSRQDWPFVLRAAEPVERMIDDAKRQIAEARRAAGAVDGDFVARLPPRVHVVRLRDHDGNTGFGPIDVPGATLAARGLSLLLADYLTRPEWYLDSSDVAHGWSKNAPRSQNETCAKTPAHKPSATYRRVTLGRRPRVVVAYDASDVLELIVRVLTEDGYEVTGARTAHEALQAVMEGQTPPDALVLDARMSEIDGLALVARSRRNDRTMPIVVVSGGEEERRHAERFGATAIVHKPLHIEDLSAALTNAFRAHHTPQVADAG